MGDVEKILLETRRKFGVLYKDNNSRGWLLKINSTT